MIESIFITGTGTDIGKTYVAGLIMKRLIRSGVNAAYFKAAMSGNIRDASGRLIPGDAMHVKTVSGTEQDAASMCPYVYEAAYSPHLAARLEGNPIELEVVVRNFRELSRKYDCILMEGSGGIMCPLRFDGQELWLADVVRACGLGCVIVADAGLGTINAVGLTASYMKHEGLKLRGIILNRYQHGNVLHEDNKRMCEHVTGVSVIACVGEGDEEITL